MPRPYQPPPPKPARMSEKRYREKYDADPVLVTVDPDGRLQFKCCGPVSGEVVANTYRRDGRTVTITFLS